MVFSLYGPSFFHYRVEPGTESGLNTSRSQKDKRLNTDDARTSSDPSYATVIPYTCTPLRYSTRHCPHISAHLQQHNEDVLLRVFLM
jgi:hypothetical protein